MKENFWKAGDILCGLHDIYMRPVCETDKADFMELQFERLSRTLREFLDDEENRKILWQRQVASHALTCVIMARDRYVGYCGIKDMRKDNWEIVIELREQWTRQGIGSTVIENMLDEIGKRLGKNSFYVKIDPGNLASQRLFEKLGAVPDGVEDLWHLDSEIQEEFEEKYQYLIDDTMRSAAEKFGVPVAKLLTRVLVYRIDWRRSASAE